MFLDKHYNDFGGLDTRSNKLKQPSDTVRRGSKNFCYNFQDELTAANGFQHKTEVMPVNSAGDIEYKYQDINTGESKSEVLMVGVDGNLYRKSGHYLKFSDLNGVDNYSFVYNEVSSEWQFSFGNTVIIVDPSTTTMDALRNTINLTGATCEIVDDSGATVVSSLRKAYLGDVVVEQPLEVNQTIRQTGSYEYSLVDCPSAGDFFPVLPFPITEEFYGTDDYEGISYLNANNVVYITDGGFPMKYDGYQVYRMGMPRMLASVGSVFAGAASDYNYSGYAIQAINAADGQLTAGTYKALFRYGFVDANGATNYGTWENGEAGALEKVIGGANDSLALTLHYLEAGTNFPVWSCTVDGDQDITATGATINVDNPHNIKVGMLLRIPVPNAPLGFPGYSFIMAYVSAVTASTITIDYGVNSAGVYNYPFDSTATTLLKDNQVIQGGYASDIYKNTITDVIVGQEWQPAVRFGAFVEYARTTASGSVFYKVWDLPVKHIGQNLTFHDFMADSDLRIAISDLPQGGELPRACKYLCTWQDQILQAGRPVDPSVANDAYPSINSVGSVVNQWTVPPNTYFGYIYSEAGLCDFQSWYWNDSQNPEGFPTSGLNEMILTSGINDRIRGLGTNKDALLVLKYRTSAVVTGALAVGDLVQEVFEADIGVVNHRTIKNCNGALVWLDPIDGFYSWVAGRLPVNIGYAIQDEIKKNPDKLDFNKSIAENFERQNLYICIVDTKMFLFDYALTSNTQIRAAWYEWDSLSGISLLNDANEDFLLNDGQRIWKMKTTGTKYDYSNHESAINFIYLTAWQTYGLPTIDKHFNRVWINSIQGGFDLTVSQYGNYNELSTIGELELNFPAESSAKLAVKDYMKACTQKLSGFSIGFTNNEVQQYVRIQGFEIELDQEYDSQEPRL